MGVDPTGEFLKSIIKDIGLGALKGAIIDAAICGFSAWKSGGSIKDIAKAAVYGAVTGAVSGAIKGAKSNVFVRAVVSAAEDIMKQKTVNSKERINWGSVAGAAVNGVIDVGAKKLGIAATIDVREYAGFAKGTLTAISSVAKFTYKKIFTMLGARW